MGAGKIAARSIDRYLQGQPLLTAEEEAEIEQAKEAQTAAAAK
jgi:hypothetical protein